MPLFASLTTASAAGFIVITYEDLATQQGWPVGRLFRDDIFRLIFGGFSVIGSVGFTIINFSFLWGVGILMLGFVCAFILSFLLKSFVQWMAIVLIIISWLLQFFI